MPSAAGSYFRTTSEFEAWPHGGCPPSARYLARLAATYGHGCTVAHLVDADDLEHLAPADRCLLTSSPSAYSPATVIAGVRFKRCAPRSVTELTPMVRSSAAAVTPSLAGQPTPRAPRRAGSADPR